jgi:hypothetical protein
MGVERELLSARQSNEHGRQILRPGLPIEEHDPLDFSGVRKTVLEVCVNFDRH